MNFSKMIFNLQNFWQEEGCALLSPVTTEVGAGTMHLSSIFNVCKSDKYSIMYVQPCTRPQDGRAGENPQRLYMHHQFQVMICPAPDNIMEKVKKSFEILGLNDHDHDLKFFEDDWKSTTIGAAGLGWEVRCNEAEVLQYTYFQQMAGAPLKNVPVELAYGLERLALKVQKKDSIFDLMWSDTQTYAEFRLQEEVEFSKMAESIGLNALIKEFDLITRNCEKLLEDELYMPAYQYTLKLSQIFNLMDCIGLSYSQRDFYIDKIRACTKNIIKRYMEFLETEKTL